MLTEQMGVYNHITWLFFIDFEVAYDTKVRSQLLTMMEVLGVLLKLVGLVRCALV